MSFQSFKNIVKTVCSRSGGGLRVRFSDKGGMFVAFYGDLVMTANKHSDSITVNFGAGNGIRRAHTAMAKVGEIV